MQVHCHRRDAEARRAATPAMAARPGDCGSTKYTTSPAMPAAVAFTSVRSTIGTRSARTSRITPPPVAVRIANTPTAVAGKLT